MHSNYYKISREKLEPEPGFELRTSGFLARCSATWAILVLMPAHDQISLLRRMHFYQAMRSWHSVIILTTSELTSPFTRIWYSNQVINWNQTHSLCLRRSEVLIPVPVQVFCLRSYYVKFPKAQSMSLVSINNSDYPYFTMDDTYFMLVLFSDSGKWGTWSRKGTGICENS